MMRIKSQADLTGYFNQFSTLNETISYNKTGIIFNFSLETLTSIEIIK